MASLETEVQSKDLSILNLVSDRAKALVKLGDSKLLNAFSMPDLFHFQQDMGKLAGLQIGRKHKQVQGLKADLAKTNAPQQAQLKASIKETEKVYQAYRQESRKINKLIHPFNERNQWREKSALHKSLLIAVRTVSNLAEQLDLKVDLSKASKVLHQIPAIVEGVHIWIERSQNKINNWLEQGVLNPLEKTWFMECLLPFLYWQLQLQRTKNGRQNTELVAYYEQRVEQSKQRTLEQIEILEIPVNRQEKLYQLASQMASSFQRSSSQVEGRNGYLAFIHHGQKGIPKQKMKALTVIHNFDMKRDDGSTPAQRLYRKEFPDLFEFLCQNVTGFKEPRRRKSKKLITNVLQR